MQNGYPQSWRRKGSRVYYVTLTEGGKRRTVSTGCAKKDDADAWVKDRIDANRLGSQQTLKDYALTHHYFEWGRCPHATRLVRNGRQIGKNHVNTQRGHLETWILTDPVLPHKKMVEIRRGDVLDFMERLIDRTTDEEHPNGKGRTVALILGTLKVLLSEAHFREHIPSDPGAKVTAPKYEAQPRGAFSLEETRILLDNADLLTEYRQHGKRIKDEAKAVNPAGEALLWFLALTGARSAEARAIRWRHIDFDTKTITIEAAAKGPFAHSEIGPPKWGKVRSLVAPELLLDRLARFKVQSPFGAPEDFIFADPDGRMQGKTWVGQTVRRALDRATTDIKPEEDRLKPEGRKLSAHSFRHGLNTLLLAAGAPVLQVQLYLGWSSQLSRILAQAQAGYTHHELLTTRDVAATIDRLFALEEKERTITIVR